MNNMLNSELAAFLIWKIFSCSFPNLHVHLLVVSFLELSGLNVVQSFSALQLSTIWVETADNARSAARTFVLGGLSEKHYGVSNFWVADRINVWFTSFTIIICP